MIVINLEKLNPDGFKQEATDITHGRLYYDDFAGNNYIQGSFVTGLTATMQFDPTGVGFSLFKLYTSTDGTNYTERKSYGGDNGVTAIDSGMILDPNDYTTLLPYPKMEVVNGKKVFVPGAGGAGTAVGAGVDYLMCRGRLVQNNVLRSGKAYFGNYGLDAATGILNTPNTLSPELTIADSWSLSLSRKISTGIYALQFRTDNGYGTVNGFVTAITDPPGYSLRFEQQVYPIWRKYETVFNNNPEVLQYEGVLTNEYMGTMVVAIDTESVAGSFSSGVIHIKTYDTDGVLADDILTAGITVEFRAFPNLGLL